MKHYFWSKVDFFQNLILGNSFSAISLSFPFKTFYFHSGDFIQAESSLSLC